MATDRPNTHTESNREFRAIFLEEITKNVVEGGTRRCSWFPSLFLHGSGRFCFIPPVPSFPLSLSLSLCTYLSFFLPGIIFFSAVKIVYEGLNIRRIPWGDYNSWVEVTSNEGMPRGG